MGSPAFAVGGARWCRSELARQIVMMEPVKHEVTWWERCWRRWFSTAWFQYGHWQLSLTFKLLCFWFGGWGAYVGHLFFFFFFFVCSVIRGGHGWWSPTWKEPQASSLVWGWKTHVAKGGIYGLQGLVWAYSRSHGEKTWKVLSYLVGLLFWWFCFQMVVYGCVVWTGSLLWYQNWCRTTTLFQ